MFSFWNCELNDTQKKLINKENNVSKKLMHKLNNKIYLLFILLLKKCKSFVTCINVICYHKKEELLVVIL